MRNRFTETPDFEYDHNNGTLALRPCADGRLKDGVLGSVVVKDGEATPGDPKVWVFKNEYTYKDQDGRTLVDHHTRGLTVGTMDDWHRFRAMAESMGFTFRSVGMYVPLSNGKRDIGKRWDKSDPSHIFDYEADEIECCRFDLPIQEQLTEVLAEAKNAE